MSLQATITNLMNAHLVLVERVTGQDGVPTETGWQRISEAAESGALSSGEAAVCGVLAHMHGFHSDSGRSFFEHWENLSGAAQLTVARGLLAAAEQRWADESLGRDLIALAMSKDEEDGDRS